MFDTIIDEAARRVLRNTIEGTEYKSILAVLGGLLGKAGLDTNLLEDVHNLVDKVYHRTYQYERQLLKLLDSVEVDDET